MLAFLVWVLAGKSANRLNLLEQTALALSLSASVVWVFPQYAVAQGPQASLTPSLAFEIQSQIQIENILNAPATALTGNISPEKVELLRSYLAQKNSPLQEYSEILLMQPNWKIILSISHAESNMCRRQLGNNCWGIGGAKYHRFYPTFAEGIVDASKLIQKYNDNGLDTPAKMMRRWVGWNNHSWVRANNQVLAQLDAIGI
ncbi:MAG: hypothetical protein A2722_04405 [Candidatus Doudnabacteria bacterium RIFCSPHIGHO2_01_FULL_50_11]|uniref:Mannosyl-glycoprotein endo-beta-N-acetylglucosamidase-like domain-containing protein n=1 Tax=Candidatus Doudnabacteria bacterium RIFCSPHIGHO2_01_FULL_50_11 TaxID=1817828 RepID=A0A1F5PGD9_9BACT|nr:MAG: hypothetical protein A2722_04405 [Candidatus Doudnabacteria bacterium RIFCSPHIGHO2_01_FULL_50_11]HLC44495.1 hypothetical protein [Patescibacteria group bacterium]